MLAGVIANRPGERERGGEKKGGGRGGREDERQEGCRHKHLMHVRKLI